MTESLDAFLNWFKEYYSHEYTSIPKDTKNHYIEEILLNNGQYITKQMVLSFDGCNMCGDCCRKTGCPHLDDKTNLCTRHDNPIDNLCKEYPYSGDMGIAPLVLSCKYIVSFFIQYFNDFFSNLKRSLGDKDE